MESGVLLMKEMNQLDTLEHFSNLTDYISENYFTLEKNDNFYFLEAADDRLQLKAKGVTTKNLWDHIIDALVKAWNWIIMQFKKFWAWITGKKYSETIIIRHKEIMERITRELKNFAKRNPGGRLENKGDIKKYVKWIDDYKSDYMQIIEKTAKLGYKIDSKSAINVLDKMALSLKSGDSAKGYKVVESIFQYFTRFGNPSFISNYAKANAIIYGTLAEAQGFTDIGIAALMNLGEKFNKAKGITKFGDKEWDAEVNFKDISKAIDPFRPWFKVWVSEGMDKSFINKIEANVTESFVFKARYIYDFSFNCTFNTKVANPSNKKGYNLISKALESLGKLRSEDKSVDAACRKGETILQQLPQLLMTSKNIAEKGKVQSEFLSTLSSMNFDKNKIHRSFFQTLISVCTLGASYNRSLNVAAIKEVIKDFQSFNQMTIKMFSFAKMSSDLDAAVLSKISYVVK